MPTHTGESKMSYKTATEALAQARETNPSSDAFRRIAGQHGVKGKRELGWLADDVRAAITALPATAEPAAPVSKGRVIPEREYYRSSPPRAWKDGPVQYGTMQIWED